MLKSVCSQLLESGRWIYLVGIYEDVDGGGEGEEEVAELDHDPPPEGLVGQLPIAGGGEGEEEERGEREEREEWEERDEREEREEVERDT